MAAGSFVLVKQGDVYRLLYAAKNYQTGLTDITAIVRSPSGASSNIPWSGTNPLAGFCEMGNGWYYHDWDSTSKAYGTWVFLIDSASKSSPGSTRIQVVDGSTLVDTIFQELAYNVGTALSEIQSSSYGLNAIKTKLDSVGNDVTTTKNTVTDTSYGNAALKSILDTINNTVGKLSNNADAKIALIDVMLIPDSGSSTYKFFFRFYDSDNNMEDPDNQNTDAYVAVSVANSQGTDRSANLGGLSSDTFGGKKWMTRESVGVFSATYTVANTHAVEDLIFSFDLKENGNSRSFGAISRTATSSSDIASKLDVIENKIDIVDGNVDDIEAIVSNATYGLSALKTLLDLIHSDTSGVGADLSEIKGTGFDTAQDSLRQVSLRTKSIEDKVAPGGIAF